MPPQRGPRPRGRRPQRAPQPIPEAAPAVAVAEPTTSVVTLPKTIQVGDLARALDASVVDVIRGLVNIGLMVSINETVDFETASLVANELGIETRPEEEAVPVADEEALTPEAIGGKEILWEDVDPAKLKVIDNLAFDLTFSQPYGYFVAALNSWIARFCASVN